MSYLVVKKVIVLLLLAVAIFLPSLKAASITVTNHSFESGTTGWTALGGVHSVNEGLSPRPDGTTNNAWSNGTDGYQVTSTSVQPNTSYTLTVDVGDRSGTAFPIAGTRIRLGVGSTYGGNLLYLSDEVRSVPTTGWVIWTATFESGSNPPSGNLRVELVSGGTQSQFDNVRLVSTSSSLNTYNGWDAFVPNHSFEKPNVANGSPFSPDLWSQTGAASGADINGVATHDATPDTTDSEQIVYSNGDDWYLVLDGFYMERRRTYELTVDVGDRTDLAFGGANLRLGTGATYGANLLAATVISNTTPTNAGGASDGWQTWQSTFTGGNGVEGEVMRIELVNPGGIQTLFDNVRLKVSPLPSKGTLFRIE